MQILLAIHHELDPNAGAPGSTLKLGQEYQKLGHQVQYYSFDELPRWVMNKAKSLVFPWLLAARISSLTKNKAIDVVDASTGDAWVWAKIRRNSGETSKNSPLLVTRSHGLEHLMHLEHLEEKRRGNLHLSWKYPLYNGGYRLWEVANSLRYSDLVFLLNRCDSEYAFENLGVKPEKTQIMPNGIPDLFLNLPCESSLTQESATIGIAQVGSYIQRKGIQYGTPALNAILDRYPQVKVSFLGTGCKVEKVLADFAPNLRSRVEVVPHYNHETLPKLLAGHQIKLFPTISEGFGLAAIEAMACGLAPVATTTPGPKEIISDGQDGILIPPRDSKAIEQALERLIANRAYLEQLRRNAHATAQKYSWESIARKTISLYEETLKQKRDADRVLSS